MVVTLDQELGKVGVLLHRADHHPPEVPPQPDQDLLQEVVGEGALRLHSLQLHRYSAGLSRSDPDRQDPRAILLPQYHNWSVRRSIQAEMRNRNFNHPSAQVPASQLARYSTCSAVSASIATPMLCSFSFAISWSTETGSRCTA